MSADNKTRDGTRDGTRDEATGRSDPRVTNPRPADPTRSDPAQADPRAPSLAAGPAHGGDDVVRRLARRLVDEDHAVHDRA